jgi:hypothetical protein
VEFAVVVEELAARDHTLGLQSGMHGDPLVVDVDHHAGDDGAHVHLDGLQALFKKLRKILGH